MKSLKILRLVCLSVTAVALSACAPLEFEEYPGEEGAKPTNTMETSAAGGDDALPVETRLVLGTLLLEKTDLAVDARQAAVLLPLWNEWRALSRNNPASPEEREALLGRIQSAMTEDQLEAVAAMALTQADVDAYVQETGMSMFPTPGGTLSATDEGGSSDVEPTRTLSPDELATLQSVYRGFGGNSRGFERALLRALIALLESKNQA